MKSKMADTTNRILFFFCLIFFISLLLQGSTLPFVGINSWNFNTYSQIAKNYNTFGYLDTYLAPIVSVSVAVPMQPEYYLHHPQLLSLIQAVFFRFLSESFFVARLPVIVASIISLILIYKIANELKGKKFALFCFVVGSLIPGFSIFGRMVGQESLVMMFVLLTIYSYIKYSKKGSKIWSLAAVTSVILGTLSDWPMVYFVVFFSIFAFKAKTRYLYFQLLFTAVLTTLGFLAYIYVVNSGFRDLVNAFLVRSPGEVLLRSGWYISWLGTIFLRFLIYIGPVILILSILGFLRSYYTRTEKNYSFYLFISLLFFGIFHILLYPEGSFGHAYWIYYTLPFFVFTAGIFLSTFSKNKFILLSIFFLSFVYLLGVVHWKTGENRGNVFRYVLAKVISEYTTEYEKIDVNSESAVDPDLYEYAFNLDASKVKALNHKSISIFTCTNDCSGVEKINMSMSKNVVHLYSADFKGFISRPEGLKNKENVIIHYSQNNKKESIARRTYSFLMNNLEFPQL